MMRVGSVCSGIASDALAWHPLGWTHAFFAEIAPFPSAVLAHRFPDVHNVGDFTTIAGTDGAGIDLLVGGTPCQSFSVAGLRGGMADSRGVLALEFLRLARRLAPRWLVWENVPGVLSADRGRAFGAFLGGLAELGYGWSYRILDAQYVGLAQRRKRVFVVAHAGGAWQRAAAVLLERASLCGDPPPSRAPGEEVAGCLEARARSGGHDVGAHDVGAHGAASGHLVAAPIQDPRGRREQGGTGVREPGAPSYTIEGHPPAVALIPFDTTQVTSRENRSACEPGSPSPSLSRTAHAPAVAFHHTQDPISGDVTPALGREGVDVGVGASVRRLTPRECERLMGMPDDWTLLPPDTYEPKRFRADEVAEMAAYLGLPLEEARAVGATPDGPRYAAIGNAIAVPCLRWIGERIAHADGMELVRANVGAAREERAA
jgi:DNA (cytosine-5)-methyltransferase 1